MTDKTGNHKIRPPKLAITPSMLVAGKAKLDALTSEDHEEFNQINDDILVAEVFLAMWNAYWEQVMMVQKAKDSPSNILIMPKREIITH